MPTILGQHFLKNKAVVQKIIAALDMQPGETIVEIGPGHGALTIPLAEAAAKMGASIIAVEKDAALAEVLKGRISADGGAKENVEIVVGDILDVLEKICVGRHANKIVGNIPYYITGHLLRTIGELESKPKRAILMIQKEVAERACTAPPDMNRLAASVQYWATPKIITNVPRSDFSPVPKVDSAVIMLEVKPEMGQANRSQASAAKDEQYYAAMRALFAQPRKTIINNILQARSDHTRADVETAIAKLGIDPKARPQNLTIENIMQIAEIFF